MKPKPKASPAAFAQLAELITSQAKHEEPTPPTFSDLWSKASRAVAELIETFPEQYWERASKSARLPMLFPRKRHEQMEFMNLLENKGVMLKAKGKQRQHGIPINIQVEAAYEKVQEMRFELQLMKMRGDKLPSILAEVESLPPLRTKTAKRWMHWMVEAFLDTHKGKPEEDPELMNLVRERVDQSKDSPAPKHYRNEIKKDFRKAAERFAKDQTTYLGDYKGPITLLANGRAGSVA